jgi:hypothetical protein
MLGRRRITQDLGDSAYLLRLACTDFGSNSGREALTALLLYLPLFPATMESQDVLTDSQQMVFL